MFIKVLFGDGDNVVRFFVVFVIFLSGRIIWVWYCSGVNWVYLFDIVKWLDVNDV